MKAERDEHKHFAHLAAQHWEEFKVQEVALVAEIERLIALVAEIERLKTELSRVTGGSQ